jgi:hypothetical protein
VPGSFQAKHVPSVSFKKASRLVRKVEGRLEPDRHRIQHNYCPPEEQIAQAGAVMVAVNNSDHGVERTADVPVLR